MGSNISRRIPIDCSSMSINTSSSGVGTLRAVSAPGQSSHIDSRFAYSMASEWAQCGLVDVGASSSGKRSVVASFEPLKQDSERCVRELLLAHSS